MFSKFKKIQNINRQMYVRNMLQCVYPKYPTLSLFAILSFQDFCCCSVTQLHLILCSPMDCSKLGLPVHHQLPEFTQTHAHWVSDAIQPSHPLSSPSPPTFNLSQYQGLIKWVTPLQQVAKVLELQLQHQSFQWIFRADFLLCLTPFFYPHISN